MKIKNIIFDVGNVIVRWSPIHIIEKKFPAHQSHEHQFFIDEIFRSDILIQLNLGQISMEILMLKLLKS